MLAVFVSHCSHLSKVVIELPCSRHSITPSVKWGRVVIRRGVLVYDSSPFFVSGVFAVLLTMLGIIRSGSPIKSG